MRALDRKLLRELWQMRGQVFSIAMVVACGMAILIAMLGSYNSLRIAQELYYDRYRFADVFAQLKRAPQALEERIRDLPGVTQVQTRVFVDVKVGLGGGRAQGEPIVGRLISIRPHEPQPLNRIFLRKGRELDPHQHDEALVAESFAEAHDLKLGDTVDVVINGRWQQLRIVGIALSPEYVFALRGGDIVPNERRFGIFWMSEDALASVLDMEGAFNDVALKLSPGAAEDDVIRRLDVLIEPYGGIGAYGRSKHISALNLANKLSTLRDMAQVAPTIFLGVAAFLLNVVLLRMINTQRPRIAALKALGLGNGDIGLHYIKFVLVIVLIGLVLGAALGIVLGQQLTALYARFYRFPALGYRIDVRIISVAAAVSLLAGLLGALGSVRRAVRLPPAEAMRPAAPKTFKATLVERLGLQRFFSQQTRMIIRQLERQLGRTLVSVFGIAFAVAIIVVGNVSRGALDWLLEFQFRIVQREDVTVLFSNPLSSDARMELARIPGVSRVEASRAVPVRLIHGHRFRDLAVIGVQPDATLHRFVDANKNPIALPDEGIIMTQYLAEILGIRPGSKIRLDVREGARPSHEVVVAGLVEELIGVSVYMNINALNRMMGDGDQLSSAYLSVDKTHRDQVLAHLYGLPNVASVGDRDSQMRVWQVDLGEATSGANGLLIVFAVAIAIGVVYNSAQIAFMERANELGCLRVMGFTRGEVSTLLLSELMIQIVLAIPIGCAIGYFLGTAAMRSVGSELYRFPIVIQTKTFVAAGLIVTIAGIVSGLIVRRKLDRLDLVEVLKSRE